VSVINTAKLHAVLQMSQQHQAQLLLMVKNMLDIAEHNITQIEQFLQQQQKLALQQLLHKIRGGYATLGAEKLAEKSRELEHQLDKEAKIADADVTDFIQLYRQTCQDMHAELTRYPKHVQNTATQHPPLQLNQLYTMLVQQDMQACQIVQQTQNALAQLLTPAGAARFSQHVGALEFSCAAEILKPYLTSNRGKDK
jgi:chemotaxis protein histidine kinase CheA